MQCNTKHRKVQPLKGAIEGYRAWINARRRDQGGLRTDLAVVEQQPSGMSKVHPLAFVSRDWVLGYLTEHDVPIHPLLEQGYGSVGCEPCTRAVRPGEDERAGRWWWENEDDKECGLHVADDQEGGLGI